MKYIWKKNLCKGKKNEPEMGWILDAIQEYEICTGNKFICLSLDWGWALSATYPDAQRANERLVRGHASEDTWQELGCWEDWQTQPRLWSTSSVGVSVDTRSLVQTPDSRAVQADPSWHCLGSYCLDLATDYVASDALFGLSSSCCLHLRSDLGLETFTLS